MPFSVLLPLLLISSLGYGLTKWRWLTPNWFLGVNNVTAKILVPCLLFKGMSNAGFANLSWFALLAFYIPLIGIFLLMSGVFRRLGKWGNATLALSSTYSNSVFVGIPLLIQSRGEASLQYAYPIIAFHSLICFSLFYWSLAHNSTQTDKKFHVAILNTVKNPIVTSLLLGIIFNIFSLSLPIFINTVIGMLSNAALPCALLVLGASLTNFKLQNNSSLLNAIALKLCVFPLLVLGFAHFVFQLNPENTAVLVLLASCPLGINAFAVVQDCGEDASEISSAVLGSSLASIVSLPFFIWLLEII